MQGPGRVQEGNDLTIGLEIKNVVDAEIEVPCDPEAKGQQRNTPTQNCCNRYQGYDSYYQASPRPPLQDI